MSTEGVQGRLVWGSASIRVKASSKTRRLAKGSKWLRDIVLKLLMMYLGGPLKTSSDYNHKICVLYCQVFCAEFSKFCKMLISVLFSIWTSRDQRHLLIESAELSA